MYLLVTAYLTSNSVPETQRALPGVVVPQIL
jgi:hypothetical protein